MSSPRACGVGVAQGREAGPLGGAQGPAVAARRGGGNAGPPGPCGPSGPAADPRQPVRDDAAERRAGTCPRCLCFAPRQGWRPGQGSDRRTARDVAYGRQALGAVPGPPATVLRGGGAQRHTQTPAAVSATCPPAAACRMLRQRACAGVSTPGVDRRLGAQETVRRAIAAGAPRRQAAQTTVDGRCTTAKARRTRTHLSPC